MDAATTFVARIAFSRSSPMVVIFGTTVSVAGEDPSSPVSPPPSSVKFWAETDGPVTALRAWSKEISSDSDAERVSGGAFATVAQLARFVSSPDPYGGVPPRAMPTTNSQDHIVVVFTVPASGYFGEKTFVITLEPVSMKSAVRNAAVTACAISRKYDAMVGGASCEFRFLPSSSYPSCEKSIHLSPDRTKFSVRHPVHPAILTKWYATERDHAMAVKKFILDDAIEPYRTRLVEFILDSCDVNSGSNGDPLPPSLMRLALASSMVTSATVAIPVFAPSSGRAAVECTIVFETRAGGSLHCVGVSRYPTHSFAMPSVERDAVWIDGSSGAPVQAFHPRTGVVDGTAGDGCVLYEVHLRLGGDKGRDAARFSVDYRQTDWISFGPLKGDSDSDEEDDSDSDGDGDGDGDEERSSFWYVHLVPRWNTRVELLGHLCRFTTRPPLMKRQSMQSRS